MSTNRHNHAVVYLVGQHFSGFLVDRELGALLVRLLHDGILDLPVDAFVFVGRVYLCRVNIKSVRHNL